MALSQFLSVGNDQVSSILHPHDVEKIHAMSNHCVLSVLIARERMWYQEW